MFGGRGNSMTNTNERSELDDDDNFLGRNGLVVGNNLFNTFSSNSDSDSSSNSMFTEMDFEVPSVDVPNPFESLLNFDVPNLSVSDAIETVKDRVEDIASTERTEIPFESSINEDTVDVEDLIERVSEPISLPKLGIEREESFDDTSFGEFSFGEATFDDSNIGDSDSGESSFGPQESVDNMEDVITDVTSSFADRMAPDFSLPNYSFNPSEMFSDYSNDNTDHSYLDSSYGQDNTSLEEE